MGMEMGMNVKEEGGDGGGEAREGGTEKLIEKERGRPSKRNKYGHTITINSIS